MRQAKALRRVEDATPGKGNREGAGADWDRFSVRLTISSANFFIRFQTKFGSFRKIRYSRPEPYT
jgi:hypothetical protein